MASINPPDRARIALAAGDTVRIRTAGQCTVRGVTGAHEGTVTLNAESRDFGPYGVPAVLLLSSVAGLCQYSLAAQPETGASPSLATVTPVTPAVGAVLTSETADGWAVTRQWVRITNGVPADIPGATGTTYTLTADDIAVGVAVALRVTPASYTALATAAAAAPAPAPAPTPAPAPAPAPAPSPAPAPTPAPAPADTRPRWFLAPANGHTTNTAALIAGGTVLAGSANGGKTGTATITTTSGNYAWAAFAVPAGATSYTVTFTDASNGNLPGGWNGAGLAGVQTASGGAADTTTVFSTGANGQRWALFRQAYPHANPTATNWTTA